MQYLLVVGSDYALLCGSDQGGDGFLSGSRFMRHYGAGFLRKIYNPAGRTWSMSDLMLVQYQG
jgi:hypothetical protein